MRKHGGTPSRRDKHVTLAAISPPGVARGRFVGGQQSGLAGSKPPPLFTREASSCSSQGRRQGEPWGASPRPSAPTYLPTCYHGGLTVLSCSATRGNRGNSPDSHHSPFFTTWNSEHCDCVSLLPCDALLSCACLAPASVLCMLRPTNKYGHDGPTVRAVAH